MGAFAFHDSLTRRLREFVPQEKGVVRMYNCGPTVYYKQHIGNYRAYVCWDVLRRSLELEGHRVDQVVNITDVGHLTVDDLADAQGEDKMELASRRERLEARDVAKKYTEYFFDVAKALNWRPAERYPRATDEVPDMIKHVEELIRRGHAYVTPAGNVYFEVATFPDYGKLSGNTIGDLVAGARVEVVAEKRHPADFALWKRDDKHQMQWDSPWGRGFPGWHLECSVMARKYLGDTLDIHTGGEDHLFPHHECEIAQSETVTGKPLANYWLHNRFLLVDGQKMSKSRGTMYVLEDVERHFEVETEDARRQVHRVVRYFLLSAHYRAPLNFTFEAIEGAKAAVESLDAMVRTLAEDAARSDRPEIAAAALELGTAFLAALKDDLNTSAALSAVHEFRAFVNRSGPFSPADSRRVKDAIRSFDSVLGLDLLATPATSDAAADAAIDRLVAERQEARKSKDFARADAIRRKLVEEGIVLEDTPAGVRWYRSS